MVDVGSKGLGTEQRIPAEAKRLLLEKGYDATTIADITEASGIRRASFYTYFTSKQDVLMEIGHDAEEAGVVAAEGLRRLDPQRVDRGRRRVGRGVLCLLGQAWVVRLRGVSSGICEPRAAGLERQLRDDWRADSRQRIGQASRRQARARSRPAGAGSGYPVDDRAVLVSLACCRCPAQASAVAYSIAQLISASAHTD